MFFKQFKGDPTYKEDSRLGILGLGQFGFRAAESRYRGEVITQRGIGAVDPLAG